MTTGLFPKTALAALAATALFLPFGAPLPGSCVRAVGVAGAAPSPSCGGDLRECLRAAADMHQTTFGGRYVTADDVARCMEAFRSCTSGGAGRAGNAGAPKSTAPPQSRTPSGSAQPGSGSQKTLAEITHLSLQGFQPGVEFDCRISSGGFSCTAGGDPETRVETLVYKAEINGTVSGLTMTGNATEEHQYVGGKPGCVVAVQRSGPITYVFKADSTAVEQWGPIHHQSNNSGSCGGSSDNTYPAMDRPVTWSAVG